MSAPCSHSYPPFLDLCRGNRAGEVGQMVERFPGLVNEPVPTGGDEILGNFLHPVEYALFNNAQEAAAVLLAHPALEGGAWVQKMLAFLSMGFCLQRESSRRALPLLPLLANLGACPLKPDPERRGEVPLFSVIAYTSTMADFMGSIHGYLSCFSLQDAPPLDQEARLEFGRVIARFDDSKWEEASVSRYLAKGEAVPARFDKALPSLVDWLCGTGWTDPVFLEWARHKAPAVVVLHEQERLEGLLTKAGAGVSGSPRRL